MPDMVQIGNEVIGGMMWPDGRLPENWYNFAELVKAGISGVDAGRGDDPRAEDHDPHRSGRRPRRPRSAFFDKLRTHGIEYDVIGQSYYPWWHGSLNELRDNLAFMAREYQKDIILVEVAYNWRPARRLQEQAGTVPETPEGQRQFLDEVNRVVMETPNGRGRASSGGSRRS